MRSHVWSNLHHTTKRKCNNTDRCCMDVCMCSGKNLYLLFFRAQHCPVTPIWNASPLMVLSHNKQSCKLYHTWYTSVNHALQLRYLFVSVCVDESCKTTAQYHMSVSSILSHMHLPVRSTFSGVRLPIF